MGSSAAGRRPAAAHENVSGVVLGAEAFDASEIDAEFSRPGIEAAR
jgi:hypothetical protein